MKIFKVLCLFLLVFLVLPAQGNAQSRKGDPTEIHDGKSLVKAMHAAASRTHLKEYTFVQQTIRFDSAGKALPAATWYEALRYPDFFRIDVGDPANGRGVIYRNDSTYSFREGKLARATAEPMPFMLLEGGLKCYALEEVLSRSKKWAGTCPSFIRRRSKARKCMFWGRNWAT